MAFSSQQPPVNPARAVDRATLAEFNDYSSAQALVDRLSDAGFPVENVQIVGTGIRSVEQVKGRLTNGKAALYGAGSGAWFGLLIGLLFGIFSIGFGWFAVLLISVALGALWGALFGFLAHSATRGKRDFSSVQTLEAAQYAVLVETGQVAEARRLTSLPA